MRNSIILFVSALSLLTSRAAFCNPSQNAPTDAQVAALIDKMVNAQTEHQAFADLEAMGCPAVPAIIRQMDDRRKLPDHSISLRNKFPNAFEGVRYYGPEEVVDALAAILNQITEHDFGSIYNGGTEEDRKKAIQGWRHYLESTPTSKICPES
jgi:hypothetical protein